MTDPSAHPQSSSMGIPQAAPVSFRALYEGHFKFVWHLARRLGMPERHLEDAAHEVFVVVHRKLDTFEASDWIAAEKSKDPNRSPCCTPVSEARPL